MKYRMENDREIEALYKEFKGEFLRNTSKYGLTQEQRLDIYQDAFIALYEMVKYKKIEITAGLRNYLFGIGRNMILDKIKREMTERKLKEDLYQEQIDVDLGFYEIEEFSPLQQRLQEALLHLSESCRKVLTLFYYRQYSIEAVMQSMNYLNENVTKSHKSRCMKKLKEIVATT